MIIEFSVPSVIPWRGAMQSFFLQRIRYGFFGRMDEVLVANRAFRDEEIARFYELGKP